MARLSRNRWPLHFGKVHSPDIVESLNGGAGQTLGRTYGQRSNETWELALYEILGDALEHNLAIMLLQPRHRNYFRWSEGPSSWLSTCDSKV